ncbi:hypothetical protein DJ95_1867 [Bacillus atrophaeus subsp. globigii]|nr:hypothetical protein DJ95_1867 [Bacillus atrophaeus subsp. globigii]KFK81526.1 hypothetical protein DK44_1766 [Bacillus atrophaeus]
MRLFKALYINDCLSVSESCVYETAHMYSLCYSAVKLYRKIIAQGFGGLQGGTGVGGARASASNIYTMENTFWVVIFCQSLYSHSNNNTLLILYWLYTVRAVLLKLPVIYLFIVKFFCYDIPIKTRTSVLIQEWSNDSGRGLDN